MLRTFMRVCVLSSLTVLPACAPMENVPTENTNDNVAEPAPEFFEFEDPETGFKTTDLLDSEGEIVRFNLEGDTLIFAADGTTLTGWSVHGLFFDAAEIFLARFGIVDGVQHAYFTETVPATICDIEVQDGVIFIFPTEATVPQS